MSERIDEWHTDPECIELSEFLIEKTKDVQLPMSRKELRNEFKQKTGSTRRDACLYRRINRFCKIIPKSIDYDLETKVKLLFALKHPIEDGFLHEMEEVADVKLNEFRQIIEYKTKGEEVEGFHLNGVETERKDTSESIEKWRMLSRQASLNDSDDEGEIVKLLRYVTEVCLKANSPLSICQLCKDFRKSSSSSEDFRWCVSRMAKYRSLIHILDGIELNSQVRQIFALSVPVSSEFVKELRVSAFVEVDHKQRIIKYESKDGNLKLEGNHKKSRSRKGKSRKTFQMIENAEEDDSYELGESSNTSTGSNISSRKRKTSDDVSPGTSLRNRNNKIRDDIITASDSKKRMISKKIVPEKKQDIEDIHEYNQYEDSNVKRRCYFTFFYDYPIEKVYTNRLKVLECIHTVIVGLNRKLLAVIKQKVCEAIKRAEGGNEEILITEFLIALKSCCCMMTEEFFKKPLSEESSSLKEFVQTLRRPLIDLKLPYFDSFLRELKKKEEELNVDDKFVSVEDIRIGFEMILEVCTP